MPSGVLPTAHAEALWPEVRAALDGCATRFDPQGFEPTRDAAQLHAGDGRRDRDRADAGPGPRRSPRGHARADLRVLPLSSRDPRPLLEQGAADLAVGFFPDVAAALAAEGGGR